MILPYLTAKDNYGMMKIFFPAVWEAKIIFARGITDLTILTF